MNNYFKTQQGDIIPFKNVQCFRPNFNSNNFVYMPTNAISLSEDDTEMFAVEYEEWLSKADTQDNFSEFHTTLANIFTTMSEWSCYGLPVKEAR